jgi:predicted LPLAT superfamily acyltransferase
MVGLYRGGNRYDVFFERLIEPAAPGVGDGTELVASAMRSYVHRLEHYCRLAPYNWFNFYDFWK